MRLRDYKRKAERQSFKMAPISGKNAMSPASVSPATDFIPDSVTTILFDLDNTLISTRKADRTAIAKALAYLCTRNVPESHGRQVVEGFYHCLRVNPEDPIKGRTELDSWRTLLWAYALGPQFAHLARDVYPLWKRTRFEHIDFEADTLEMLVALRPHYKLGLITNGPSTAQWEKVVHLGADDLFDVVLVGGDHVEQKPCPSIFRRAFDALHVQPNECVMVGDMLSTDIQGGVNAGVAATVWMPLQVSRCDDPSPKPDFIIERIGELLPILGLDLLAA